MKKDELYFDPIWLNIHADRAGLKTETFSCECPHGKAEYTFMRRPIEIRGEAFPYWDIVTPYAFSGPFLEPIEDTPECEDLLAREFDACFDRFCTQEGIIAEYVQFNPWIGGERPFREIYDLQYRTLITGIDLTKPDLMQMEFSSRRRRAIRNAINRGVTFHVDYEGERIDDFIRLYQFTIDKYDADPYYQYDRAFYERLFRDLKGRVYFGYCLYEGSPVSMGLFLESGDFVHYYLGGHDAEMLFTNASSLLFASVAEKAQKEGRKLMVMGGAKGSLLEYKMTFTKDTTFRYFVGKKIRSHEIYDMLAQRNGKPDTAFFPAYRDNR